MAPSSQKGTDNANVDRAYVADVSVSAVVTAESSPALTSSHNKNSKEMPDQSLSSASVSNNEDVPTKTTIIEDEPISHSKNSVLQSNNMITIQQPTKSVTQPIQSITANNNNNSKNNAHSTNPGSIIGLIISVLGITLFGTAILLRNRRQRQQRSKINHNHTSSNHLASLDRNNYTDETPIRVRIMAEDENNDLELDEVLGEEDDVVSIGECSLEEIELEESGVDGVGCGTYGEYLRNISDEFEEGGERSDGSDGSAGYFPSIFA
jgi:ATP-dependent Zn protease